MTLLGFFFHFACKQTVTLYLKGGGKIEKTRAVKVSGDKAILPNRIKPILIATFLSFESFKVSTKHKVG